jgi:large subunit ribosomal protein L24
MVIAGREKGKQGKVMRVINDEAGKPYRVVVEKLNMVKRHTKPGQGNRTGGIIEKEAPLHVSNVMPLDPKTDKPTRVRSKIVDGKRIRVAKSGEALTN